MDFRNAAPIHLAVFLSSFLPQVFHTVHTRQLSGSSFAFNALEPHSFVDIPAHLKGPSFHSSSPPPEVYLPLSAAELNHVPLCRIRFRILSSYLCSHPGTSYHLCMSTILLFLPYISFTIPIGFHRLPTPSRAASVRGARLVVLNGPTTASPPFFPTLELPPSVSITATV